MQNSEELRSVGNVPVRGRGNGLGSLIARRTEGKSYPPVTVVRVKVKGSAARPGERPNRRAFTAIGLATALALILAGVLLLVWAGQLDPGTGQTLIRDLGGLVVVSAGIGLFWELVGRRAFAREVLESARTSADVESTGLMRVGMNYIEIADWQELFANVRHLDIFLAYGRTWRNSYLTYLQQLARTPSCQIRVVLPDPEDTTTVERLAERFSMTPAELRTAIIEATEAYKSLPVGPSSSVEIYHRKGDSLLSFYRFDKVAVITMYSHSRTRTGVPTFVVRQGGSLYQFVREELKALRTQAVCVHGRSATGPLSQTKAVEEAT